MSTLEAPKAPQVPKLRPARPASPSEALIGSRAYAATKSAGEMGSLALATIRIAVRHPRSWARDFIVECSLIFRRCTLPVFVGHGVFLLGFGIILFGLLLTNLGAVDRQPGGVWITWIREESSWITGMIFAGMAGSAAAADLGARKIREELDALSVLGVDAVRTLVVPRVLAMTFALPVLAIFSLIAAVGINSAIAPAKLGLSLGVLNDNLVHSVVAPDMYFMLIKTAVIGFFVGIVSCQKGLSCGAGAEGVGRAVNQTAVITFFGIWLFNSLSTLGYLVLFPDVSVLRG